MVTDDMVAVRTLRPSGDMGLHSGEETWPPAGSRAPQTGPCPPASRMDRGGCGRGTGIIQGPRMRRQADRGAGRGLGGHGSSHAEEDLAGLCGPRSSAPWNRLAGCSHQPLSPRCGERRAFVTETLLHLSLGSAGSLSLSCSYETHMTVPSFYQKIKATHRWPQREKSCDVV